MASRAARKKSGRLRLEADEIWSFIGKKREMWWIWVALDAETRQVVAMVAGDRSEFTARCLWDSLPEAYRAGAVVFSDFWAAYAAVAVVLEVRVEPRRGSVVLRPAPQRIPTMRPLPCSPNSSPTPALRAEEEKN